MSSRQHVGWAATHYNRQLRNRNVSNASGTCRRRHPPIEEVHPPAPAENIVNNTYVQLKMLWILQEMQNVNAGQGRRGGRCGRDDNNHKRNRCTPDNATFNRRITNQYCHTHGWCNYVSADYKRKVAHHNNAATINNRLVISNAFFQPVADEWRGETQLGNTTNELNNIFKTPTPSSVSSHKNIWTRYYNILQQ